MKTRHMIVAGSVILLASCASTPVESLRASAQLQPTKGNTTTGEATFTEVNGKIQVVATVRGLKPGTEHGFHIHEVGDCSSGDGMSTKGHFNPFGKAHAHAGTPERHAGDLPTLRAAADGTARVDVMLDVIAIAPGPASIVGRGLIVHADPDDYKTQPTGNSGARIACGAIKAG